jgi:hypothetical protein
VCDSDEVQRPDFSSGSEQSESAAAELLSVSHPLQGNNRSGVAMRSIRTNRPLPKSTGLHFYVGGTGSPIVRNRFPHSNPVDRAASKDAQVKLTTTTVMATCMTKLLAKHSLDPLPASASFG